MSGPRYVIMIMQEKIGDKHYELTAMYRTTVQFIGHVENCS